MPQAVTIRSLPRAFAMIKAMRDEGYEWGEDYRQGGRQALVPAEILLTPTILPIQYRNAAAA